MNEPIQKSQQSRFHSIRPSCLYLILSYSLLLDFPDTFMNEVTTGIERKQMRFSMPCEGDTRIRPHASFQAHASVTCSGPRTRHSARIRPTRRPSIRNGSRRFRTGNRRSRQSRFQGLCCQQLLAPCTESPATVCRNDVFPVAVFAASVDGAPSVRGAAHCLFSACSALMQISC